MCIAPFVFYLMTGPLVRQVYSYKSYELPMKMFSLAARLFKFMAFTFLIATGWSAPKYQTDTLEEMGFDSENELVPMVIDRGPFFDKTATKNVTALVGKTTYLNCRVRNLGNRTVTWIRHRDLHLLTVGMSTYTSDQRFTCIHNPMTENWTLQIRYPQRRDSGMYECQVGTTPPIGHSMTLSVVEPITTLLGGPEMYINKGSTMNLTCMIKHSPEPPHTITWTHNSMEINYDSPRGGVTVITEKGDITVSYILVQKATEADSGKYSCHPSNANPKTVIVHVLNGEQPAAMQHGGQLRLEYPLPACLLSVLVAMVGH